MWIHKIYISLYKVPHELGCMLQDYDSSGNPKLKMLYTLKLCFALFYEKLTCKLCVAGAAHLSGPPPLSLPSSLAHYILEWHHTA